MIKNLDFFRFKNLFWLWSVSLIIAIIIQALTIDILPSLQQDDALITDYGRLTLDPTSEWSVTWLVGQNKPLLIWTYIGPLLAEIGFQLGGSSGIGTRIMALIGGAFAASMSLGWLIKRGVLVYASYGIAIAFLLDPLFTYSQRMARVDSWVVGFCLAACWILKIVPEKNNTEKKYFLAAAGGLVTIASLIWPSAFFLYPLIGLEFFSLFDKSGWKITNDLKFSLKYFLGGAFTILILLLLPFWQNILILSGDISTVVSQNVETANSLWQKVLAIFNYDLWLKAIKTYVKLLTPLLPILALAGAWHRREKGLIFVTILTTILIFSTLVYEFRLLYLLPYFLALGGGLFQDLKIETVVKPFKIIRKAALVTIVFWALGVSLFLRSALAFDKYPVNNRTRIEQAALAAIGPGDYKVFLAFTFELYYIGRSLGWKLYTPYVYFNYNTLGAWTRENEYEPKVQFSKLLSEMDYAIFHKAKITEDLKKQLLEAGLNYKGTIVVNEEYRHPVYSKPESRSTQVVLWFLRGEPTYGPYEIFARKNSNQQAAIGK